MTTSKKNPTLVNDTSVDHSIIYQLSAFGGDCQDDLPEEEPLFGPEDSLADLKRRGFPSSSVYQCLTTSSSEITASTSLEAIARNHFFGRPRFRFVVSGTAPEQKFLLSVTDLGLQGSVIKDHLLNHSKAPYLLASCHGLLGMALVSAAVSADASHNRYQRASAEVEFPPSGEVMDYLGSEQEVYLPTRSHWLSSLCAPVRFERQQRSPAVYDDFLPETDSLVRWKAFKDKYRSNESRFSLPAGVGTAPLDRPGTLSVQPVNESTFFTSFKQPVAVTFPCGTCVLMCLNSVDGFGKDRFSQEKSPLLDWAVHRMSTRGGIAAIFRHGLQKTVFALLAEEVVNAQRECRRPDVPWVSDGSNLPLPVVLDSEVLAPRVNADDLYGHFLQAMI